LARQDFAAVAAVLAVLHPVASAAAQEDGAEDSTEQRARMHFNAGSSYYGEGDYESALREFQRAYELNPTPDFFYNYALVYERSGDLDTAVTYLRRYLEETPEERIQDRPLLVQRLGNLERRLEERRARDREEAERRQTDEARLRELEAQRAADQQSGGAGPSVPQLVSFGVGALGLIGFGVFGALTLAADGDLEEGCLTRGTCSQDDVDGVGTLALLADVSLLVGVAGIGVGVALLLLAGDDGDEPATALVPVLGPDSAGTMLRGTF
jgi:tetratricopeptide (TPR) repeat protein